MHLQGRQHTLPDLIGQAIPRSLLDDQPQKNIVGVRVVVALARLEVGFLVQFVRKVLFHDHFWRVLPFWMQEYIILWSLLGTS
jgi:hypothetical protein